MDRTPEQQIGGACSCEPPWKDRGMVDDRCWRHRVEEVLDTTREAGWSLYRLDDAIDPRPFLRSDGWTDCPVCGGCYLLADLANEPDLDCRHCYMGIIPPRPLIPVKSGETE